jgi:hypothetical protein
MRVIRADHDHRIAIAGVPGLVQRPVNIDRSQTDFANLRSLRVYQFDRGITIDGHAEEDEVFVVVMNGSVEFTVSGDNSGQDSRSFALSGASDANSEPCAAYLPPESAYRLIPRTDAEVAYARATPSRGNPGKVFAPHRRMSTAGTSVLLREKTYAQRLRLRLVQIKAIQQEIDFKPILESEDICEALVHIRTVPAEGIVTITTVEGDRIPLNSWDTVAVAPGDLPMLRFAEGSSGLALVVLAI